MAWQANLDLRYTLHGPRVVAHHRHDGPLRILQSLYPEGDAICHNVLIHPPGGLVGGDTLDITVHAASGTHGLITTPGATRFYRSEGALARQRSLLQLAPQARLEWLPLETLCYDACQAENRLTLQLAPGAELIGWDLSALGLPQAQQPFLRGRLTQHIEMPGIWLERAQLDASDLRLMNSPAGLAGRRCIASLFLVCGTALERQRKQRLLDAARALLDNKDPALAAGATSPHPQVLVLRVLTPLVEPAMQLLRAVRAAWRQELWQLPPGIPRIWAT